MAYIQIYQLYEAFKREPDWICDKTIDAKKTLILVDVLHF